MNRKQFVILLALLAVVGGAGLLVKRGKDNTSNVGEPGVGKKLLGDKFALNDVAHIVIKQGTNEVNLAKKDDLWRVRERNDYAANFQEIGDFLIKARDLKVIQVEEIGPSQLPRLELSTGQGTNSGVLLDLKNKDDKSLETLTLGKKHTQKPKQSSQFGGDEGFPDGRYVMLANDTKNALVIGDPLNNIEPKPEAWLNKTFFKVDRPKAVTVNFPEATNSWKIVRDTESGDWKFAEAKPGEKLDSAKASGVSSPFSSPSFNDVLALGAKSEENGFDKPTTVTVDTFDDLTYTVKVGKKSRDDYPISMTVAANFPKERTPAKDEKPEDKDKADKAWKDRQKQLEDKIKQDKTFEKWVYLVPGYTLDSLLKDRKDLLVEKKEDKPKEAAPAAGVDSPIDPLGK
jgi:hypothetical protein